MLSPHIKLFQKIKKVLELVSLPHFLHNFRMKIFLLLYCINWPNLIICLPLFYKILGNMCIAIVCKPVCEVMNFEVNLIFFKLSRFSYMTKKSWQKLKYLGNETSFWDETECIFHHFKGLSIKKITNFFGRWESDFNKHLNNFFPYRRHLCKGEAKPCD